MIFILEYKEKRSPGPPQTSLLLGRMQVRLQSDELREVK